VEKSYTTATAEETVQLGVQIGKNLRPGSVVALSGPLGSGKTTFTKGVASGLGIQETVTSPTFTLINEYEGTIPLYHIDTYRLENVEEFQEIGGEELLYDKGVVIIEWSDKIASLLPPHHIAVTIELADNGARYFSIHGA